MGNAVGQTTFASLPGLPMPAHIDCDHSVPTRETEVTDIKGRPTSLYFNPIPARNFATQHGTLWCRNSGTYVWKGAVKAAAFQVYALENYHT